MSVDFRFTVTFFRDFGAREKWERQRTIYDLAEKAMNTTAERKDALPWWKLAAFGDKRTDKASLRHDANVRCISGIEADYDAERVSFDEAAELLDKLGVMALLYTSPSHTEAAPRWRVLCPTSIGLMPEKRRHMLGRLNGAFRGIFSRESWTLSQSYYFGSVDRNPAHRAEVSLGHAIDQLDDLDEAWIGPPGETSTATAEASAELRADAELIRCAVTGEHLHVELCALAARYIGRGIPVATVEGMLRGIMLSHHEASRDARWRDRYDNIPTLVASAAKKYKGQPEARRAIARLTHRMRDAGEAFDAIDAAVLAEAERVGLASERARSIMGQILASRVCLAA
jgi:hypothetical protein